MEMCDKDNESCKVSNDTFRKALPRPTAEEFNKAPPQSYRINIIDNNNNNVYLYSAQYI